MKKILTILAIVVVALVAMMSSVNAATVNVEPAKTKQVKEGDIITVTVNTVPAQGFQFVMNYDNSIFEYQPNEGAGEFVNYKDEPGVLTVLKNAAPAKTSSITFKFKALKKLELVTDDASKMISYPFSVSDLQVSRADKEEATSANGNLVITATTAGGETTSPSGSTNKPQGGETTKTPTESDKKTKTSGDVKIGTNGKPIEKLPQTGAPIYMGAGVAIALVVAAVAIKKIRK